MYKVFKYSFFDLIRSRWSFFYLFFYCLLAFFILFLNNDPSKAIVTLMNIVVLLIPLISTIFSIMFYYNAKEFTELLLALPVPRTSVFLGQYFASALSLSLSFIIGLAVPFAFYGVFDSGFEWEFFLLICIGTLLTFTFSAIAYNIAMLNENKSKGFSIAVFIWLFFSLIYDGLFLAFLVKFGDYPLENFTLIATLLNPIDLSRILILLNLDIAAMLGYTGAVFKQFFGSSLGSLVSILMLLLWVFIPIASIYKHAQKKNF